METFLEENINADPTMCSEAEIIQDFDTHLKLTDDTEDGSTDVKQEEDDQYVSHHGSDEEQEADEEDEDDEEFSFMCGEANTSPIAAEDAFINGHIKPVFPLFNQDSLFSGDYSASALHGNLPMRPPVRKVFVETQNGEATSSSDRKAVEASPEGCKKSNSTGFSKIWRFKDLLGRSNSDGRDAFVFLNDGHAPPPAAAGEGKDAAVKRKVKKGKAAPLSAHEVYLKSKAKGEERRRSYLPYRPELMGFFTNVSGGLSKNVHPY